MLIKHNYIQRLIMTSPVRAVRERERKSCVCVYKREVLSIFTKGQSKNT